MSNLHSKVGDGLMENRTVFITLVVFFCISIAFFSNHIFTGFFLENDLSNKELTSMAEKEDNSIEGDVKIISIEEVMKEEKEDQLLVKSNARNEISNKSSNEPQKVSNYISSGGSSDSSSNQGSGGGDSETANQESRIAENQTDLEITINVYTTDLDHNLKNEFEANESFYYNANVYSSESNNIYVDVVLYSIDQNPNKIKFCSWKNQQISTLETMIFSCGPATRSVGEYEISAYIYKSDDGLLLDKKSIDYKILGGD